MNGTPQPRLRNMSGPKEKDLVKEERRRNPYHQMSFVVTLLCIRNHITSPSEVSESYTLSYNLSVIVYEGRVHEDTGNFLGLR